jgi:hypothetical protein
MIFPFLFDIFPELEKLAVVADEIAKYSGWPELYDMFQLARNEVSKILKYKSSIPKERGVRCTFSAQSITCMKTMSKSM